MFAWRVIYEADGSRQETVLAAADLLRAAEQVRQGLAAGEKILEIRSMAEVLPERAQPEPVAPPRPARRTGGTRQDQLLSVLEEVGEPVHLDVIADALDVNRAYADNIALRAIRAGLVARDGVGTGRVQLADETTEGQAVLRRSGRGGRPTRLDQLLELLRRRGEPVHMGEIATTLSVTRTHADNVVADGSRYGLLRRIGSRSGLVELVERAVT